MKLQITLPARLFALAAGADRAAVALEKVSPRPRMIAVHSADHRPDARSGFTRNSPRNLNPKALDRIRLKMRLPSARATAKDPSTAAVKQGQPAVVKTF